MLQGLKADESNENVEKPMNICPHDFKLDEEIGLICKLCGVVSTEVKDISPDFVSPSCVDFPLSIVTLCLGKTTDLSPVSPLFVGLSL